MDAIIAFFTDLFGKIDLTSIDFSKITEFFGKITEFFSNIDFSAITDLFAK